MSQPIPGRSRTSAASRGGSANTGVSSHGSGNHAGRSFRAAAWDRPDARSTGSNSTAYFSTSTGGTRSPARPERSSSDRSAVDRGGRPQRRRSGSGSGAPRQSGGGGGRSAVSALEAALDVATTLPQPEATTFEALGVPTPIVAALAAGGVHAPFAIQTSTLPDALAGRDVLGRAQTGSGKTLAFGIPMVSRLSTAAAHGQRLARGLVLVPTRELATQVEAALAPLLRSVGLRAVAVYGGAPYGKQIEAFRRGVDVVVATPGRLIDLLDRQVADLTGVEIAVLDEADHMADLGFMPAVTRILDEIPVGGQRMLFSATLDRGIDRLVERYLTEPTLHAVAAAVSPVELMEHRAFILDRDDRSSVIAAMAGRPGRSLLFVRTKHGSDRLAKQLTMAGVPAAALNGNLSQNARTRALAAFSDGNPRVLVATDVAARGIHVDDVDLVVHVDLPADHKDYLHRSGRTARAGNTGTVVSLVDPGERRGADDLFRRAGIDPDRSTVKADSPAVVAVGTSGTAPEPKMKGVFVPDEERGARASGRRSQGAPRRGPRPAPRTEHRPARRPTV